MASAPREKLHQQLDLIGDAKLAPLETLLTSAEWLSEAELEHLSRVAEDLAQAAILRMLDDRGRSQAAADAAGRRQSAGGDPERDRLLLEIPEDDEPSSPEEEAAAAAARLQYLRGEVSPWEEVREELAPDR